MTRRTVPARRGPPARPALALAAVGLVAASCSGTSRGRPATSGPTTGPVSAALSPGAGVTPPVTGVAPTAGARSPGPGARADAVAAFERTLREKLTIPPLPAFSVPTDVLTTGQDRHIDSLLHLQPGLYAGIAVVDSRCGAGGPHPADQGVPLTGPAAATHVDDGTQHISVGADGSGDYSSGDLHVAVDGHGGGSYRNGRLTVIVQASGAGRYDDGTVRLHVDPGGTGGYTDATTRVFVNPGGDAGYSDPDTHVSVAANGTVFTSGDPVHVQAALAVLKARFPLLPPVPAVQRVTPRGSSCGTVIRLDANVLFDFDAATLRPDARPLLARVVTLLRALASPRADVDGYTDHLGSAAYNVRLSSQRAGAVAAVLRAGGVAGRLVVRGLGGSDPLRPETTSAGRDDPAARQLDRRVEIVLSGAAGG